MSNALTAKSTWKQGQEVQGIYCSVPFTGKIGPNTRPTPDGKNVIFDVIINGTIVVYGEIRDSVEVWTNGNYGRIEASL